MLLLKGFLSKTLTLLVESHKAHAGKGSSDAFDKSMAGIASQLEKIQSKVESFDCSKA